MHACACPGGLTGFQRLRTLALPLMSRARSSWYLPARVSVWEVDVCVCVWRVVGGGWVGGGQAHQGVSLNGPKAAGPKS